MSALGFLRLHKGAVIKCPNMTCNDTIGVLSQDLKPGDSKVAMESGTGQGSRIDKLPHCKRCNFRWVVSAPDLMRVHTRHGWFPTEKQIMDAMYA